LKASCLIAIVTYAFLILAGHNRLQDRMDQDLFESKLSSLHIKPCTFEQLHQAFPPKGTKTSPADSEKGACWKLEDEIVRVPADHIINRNYLTPLGSGVMGGVHKAILKLNGDNSKSNGRLMCSAAIKTDHCHSWWPFQLYWQRARSCIEINSYLWRPRSYTGAEYTGALVWYAQRKLNRTVPGLLPTFALIEDKKNPVNSPAIRHENLERFPHPDPTVLGVVMPLWSFRPASEILSGVDIKGYSSSQLAKIMLPAAMGLEFVGSMGLAFRDLLEKNVGILDSTGDGIVFDNSYMGVNPVEDCKSVACQFCQEDVFPPFDDRFHHDVKGIPLGHDYILGDMHNFRKVIIKLSEQCPDTARAERMADDILHTRNVHNLIEVLKIYASETTTAV